MRNVWAILTVRLMSDAPVLRFAGWLCSLFGLAYLAMAAQGLVRAGATHGELFLGLMMAGVGSVLFLMLGLLTHHYETWSRKAPVRERYWEFGSYALCMGLMVGGILPLPTLGLSRVQVIYGALGAGALSVSVLVRGMLSSLVRALKN